jgi:hypothetical protein
MSAEQVAALEKAVAPLRSPSDDGEKGKKKSVSKLFKRALLAVLTEEQREKYEALEKERKTTARASIWVLGDDGRPDERKIRIGLVDSKFAEVVGKEVKDGEKIIVRSRSIVQN